MFFTNHFSDFNCFRLLSFYLLAVQPGKVGELVPEENATTKRECASNNGRFIALPTIALKSWILQRQAPLGEYFWASWNFTLMPDRYCMISCLNKPLKSMKGTLSEETMETLKSMIHAFWAEMILALRLHSLGRSIGPLSAGADWKPFFDSISCEAVGVDVIADNMWTFNTSTGFDVHKTRAYIEMSLSQVLACVSRVPFH